jgi:hypothetical protein
MARKNNLPSSGEDRNDDPLPPDDGADNEPSDAPDPDDSAGDISFDPGAPGAGGRKFLPPAEGPLSLMSYCLLSGL